jgi:hypothetical protein
VSLVTAVIVVVLTPAAAGAAGLPVPSVTAAVQVTNDPNPTRAHSTPQIARNPKTGELVIGEAEVRSEHSCDIHISVDNGRSWFNGGSPMIAPWTDCSRQATNGVYITFQFTPDGTLWAAFFGSDPSTESTLNRNDVPANVFVARSQDSGRHWVTTIAYRGQMGDPGIGASRRAQIAVDPNNTQNVYVGWQKGGYSTPTPGGPRKSIVQYSHDGGLTFSTPIELQGVHGGGQPKLVVDSKGVVHAIIAEDAFMAPTGAAAVPRAFFYTRSTNQGRTWSPLKVVDQGSVGFSFGRVEILAVDPKTDALYFAWYGNTNPKAQRPPVGMPSTTQFDDREILLRSSSDGGNTWSAVKTINDDTATRNIQHYDPGIWVAPNGRVDIAWYDFRNSPDPEHEDPGGNGGGATDVYYSASGNQGASFTSNIRVTDRISDRTIGVWSNNTHSHANLGLVSTNDTVYIAWQDTRNGNSTTSAEDIYFAAVRYPLSKPGRGVPGWAVLGVAAAVGLGLTIVVGLGTTRRTRGVQ